MVKFLLAAVLLINTFSALSQFYSSDLYKNRSEKLEKRNQWQFQERLYPYTENYSMESSYKTKQLLRSSGLTDNTSSWVSLGPAPAQFNFDHATSRVRVIAYDPDFTNTIYIGTSNGGVWKSDDGGNTWVPKTDFEASLSSGALAVYNDFSTTPPKRIVYYGTGEGGFGFVYSYYGRGLLKSTDGGDTWRQITNGLPPATYFYKIAVNPASPNVLLAALGSNFANPVNTGGLYRSEDFGESWTRVVPSTIGEQGLNCTDVIFSPDGAKAYILGPFITGSPNWWENGTGYRISNDGGRTFTQMPTNLPGTGYLAIHPLQPSIMYALTAVDCNISQLFRSADGGNSWSWINSNFTSNQCGYNMALEMHPTSTDIIFAATLFLYRSTNRGNDFQHNLMPFHLDVHDIAFNPKNPNELIVATDGGIAKSTNGGQDYLNLNKTLATLECYSVASDPLDNNRMLTGTQDNGVQEKTPDLNRNYSWKSRSGFDGTTVVIDKNDPNRYLVQLSASASGIHVSSNRGQTWIVPVGLGGETDYAWVRPIISSPVKIGLYYTCTGSHVYSSNDFGMRWQIIPNTTFTDKIQELAVSESNPSIMYAGTGPFEYMPNATQHFVYKSIDGGRSWINLSESSASTKNGAERLPNRYVSAIAIDKNNPNDVIVSFAGFGTNHLYRTFDGGTTWSVFDCSGNICLPDVPFNDFTIRYDDATGLREYYAATDIGVYKNTGENIWHELSEGMPSCIVMDLEIYGSKLRAATFGRGIFEWDLTGGTSLRNSSNKQSDVITADNFPNPFNPSTQITFETFEPRHIKIIVYDITGKQVSELINAKLDAGKHNITWDGTKYSSGVYFYKIEAEGFSQTKKMLLIK